MKLLFFILPAISLVLAAHAEKGPRTKRIPITHGSIQFRFNNLTPAEQHKDSVLIIFDRYNHTGAGIVYQIFAADKDQHITIDTIPAGKYFVTVQGLGLHRDRIEKIVTVKARRNGKMNIDLEDSEEFSKDTVVIPAYNPGFNDFAVLNNHRR